MCKVDPKVQADYFLIYNKLAPLNFKTEADVKRAFDSGVRLGQQMVVKSNRDMNLPTALLITFHTFAPQGYGKRAPSAINLLRLGLLSDPHSKK